MVINLDAFTDDEYQLIDKDYLKDHIDLTSNCLEIGALSNPFFDHSLDNVKNADIFSKNELKEILKNDSRGSLPLVDVDYILDPKQHYSKCFDTTFDIIYSSHVVEHQPCLVTHLLNIKSILSQDGIVIFYIPNKRYCFDYYKTESSIIDILNAYYENHWTPTFKTKVLSKVLRAHNYPIYHWHQSHDHASIQKFKLNAEQEFMKYSKDEIEEQFCSKSGYVSEHNFYYTPDSFKQIVNFLYEKNYIKLQLLRIYQTPIYSNEFLAILG